jgi:hypothetical protein
MVIRKGEQRPNQLDFLIHISWGQVLWLMQQETCWYGSQLGWKAGSFFFF